MCSFKIEFPAQLSKLSITEWRDDVEKTGNTLAHEIGHALGLMHDFGRNPSEVRYDSNHTPCTDIFSLLDYYHDVNQFRIKFSTCSKEDFRDYYQALVGRYGSYCLTCGKLL